MDQLSSPSSYETPSATEGAPSILPSTVGKFVKCGHTLHMLCMLAMYNNGTKVPELQRIADVLSVTAATTCRLPRVLIRSAAS